jgi:hypothetical protein
MATIEELRAEAKWNVKVGGKWFRFDPFNKVTEVTVTKVTKTQVTFDNEERMSRNTNLSIRSPFKFARAYFRPALDDLRAQLKSKGQL